MLKNSYYASDRLIDGKTPKQLTNYYFGRGSTFLHTTIETKGTLSSLDSIIEEDYLKWRVSLSKQDFFRQKDYRKICTGLYDFGRFLREQFLKSKTDLIAEECDDTLASKGFRKFKNFEKEAFLDGLYGRNHLFLK